MKRVLIVDDEEIARVTLAEILRLEGYLIRAVGSGEAAVDILKKEPFDVMILDLKMPGMGGIEVLKSVVDNLAELKVIVLTAHGSMDTAIQALRFRVHDYLLKPVTPKQILTSIESAIEKLKTERDTAEFITRSVKVIMLTATASLDLNKRVISYGGGNIGLTPTEARLIGTLYQLQGQMISHSDLVQACQGYRVDNEEAAKILRPVISRLRQKMAVLPGWDEWIRNVRGAGYVLELPANHG
jgi:DNA-binding response OmpR family regulator